MREKKLTNIRTTAADEKVFLQPPRQMTLEDAIGGRLHTTRFLNLTLVTWVQ